EGRGEEHVVVLEHLVDLSRSCRLGTPGTANGTGRGEPAREREEPGPPFEQVGVREPVHVVVDPAHPARPEERLDPPVAWVMVSYAVAERLKRLGDPLHGLAHAMNNLDLSGWRE